MPPARCCAEVARMLDVEVPVFSEVHIKVAFRDQRRVIPRGLTHGDLVRSPGPGLVARRRAERSAVGGPGRSAGDDAAGLPLSPGGRTRLRLGGGAVGIPPDDPGTDLAPARRPDVPGGGDEGIDHDGPRPGGLSRAASPTRWSMAATTPRPGRTGRWWDRSGSTAPLSSAPFRASGSWPPPPQENWPLVT